MEKQTFQYQLLCLRWLIFIPVGLFLICVHLLLDKYIPNDAAYYIIGVLLIWIGIDSFFVRTEHVRLYFREGQYWAKGTDIFLRIGKKTFALDDVRELFLFEARVLSSRHAVLKITAASRTWKLYSKLLKNGTTIESCDLFQLFSFIKNRRPDLQAEKDVTGRDTIDYWYRKNKT